MKSIKIIQNIDVERFRVAIFGSARLKANDPRYKQIYTLAKMIAREGMDIVTGGGPGIMEAANKGHQEGKRGNSSHSFGLNIKLPQEQIANKHLDIKKEFSRFSRRLDFFMALSNVVVVAPGGIGTLLELMYAWQLVQVTLVSKVPLILLGKMWPPFVRWVEKWMEKKRMIDEEDLQIIFLAKDTKEAMQLIRKTFHQYRKNNHAGGNGKKKLSDRAYASAPK